MTPLEKVAADIRVLTSTPVSLFAIGFFLLFFFSSFVHVDPITTVVINALAIITMMSGVFIQILRQLRFTRIPDFTKRSAYQNSGEIRKVENELNLLKKSVSDISIGISSGITEENSKDIRKQFAEFFGPQALLIVSEDIKKRISNNAEKQIHLTQIRRIVDIMINRLTKEIEELGARANVNLAIGGAVGSVGFIALAWWVFVEPHNYGSGTDIVINVSIRMSLIIFIEIFAYFFLGLYRHSIFEIKYFQNEITNADFRVMALETALIQKDSATIKKVCEEFTKTERNFLIKKTDTTIDIRRAELLAQNDRTISAWFERIVNRLTPHSANPGAEQGRNPR